MLSECLIWIPSETLIGFWAIFGVLMVIVILLAAGPLFFVISLVRAASGPTGSGAGRAVEEVRRVSRTSSAGSTRS